MGLPTRITFAAASVVGCIVEVARCSETCSASIDGDCTRKAGKVGRALLQAGHVHVSSRSVASLQPDDAPAPSKTTSLKLLDHLFNGAKESNGLLTITSVEQALNGTQNPVVLMKTHGTAPAQQEPYVVAQTTQTPVTAEETTLPAGTLGKHIKDKLLPAAADTKTALQQELQDAMLKLTACNDLAWGTEAAVKHKAKILAQDEAKRYADIAEEHRRHVEARDLCAKVTDFLENTGRQQPPRSDDTEKTVPAVSAMLKANMDFFTEKYPLLGPLDTTCRDAKAAVKKMAGESEVDTQIANEFYCKMKAGRDSACAAYAACFTKHNAHYMKVEATVKDLEASNKEHFKTLSCAKYVDENGDLQNSNCDIDGIATTYLDVSYPDHPVAIECPHLVETHRDYSGITCDADGNIVTTTTTTEAPATTSADEDVDEATDQSALTAAPDTETTVAPA